MAESIEDLNKSVRELGDLSKKTDRVDSAIGLISSLIKGISSTLDGFDKFLKKHGVDLKARATQAKGAIKGGFTSVGKLLDEKGVTKKAHDVIAGGADIAGQIGEKWSSYDENTMGPPRPGEELKAPVGKLERVRLMAQEGVGSTKNKLTSKFKRLKNRITDTEDETEVGIDDTEYSEFDDSALDYQEEKKKKGFFNFGKGKSKKRKSWGSTPVLDTISNGFNMFATVSTMGVGQLSMSIASNLEKATWFVTKHSAKLAWGVAKWSSGKLLGGIKSGLTSLGSVFFNSLDKLSGGRLSKGIAKVKEKGKQALDYLGGVGSAFMGGFNKATGRNKPSLTPTSMVAKSGFAALSRSWDGKSDPEEEPGVDTTEYKEFDDSVLHEQPEEKKKGLLGRLGDALKRKPETWDEKQEEREAKRKEEIEEQKKSDKERAKPKKKNTWLSKILGAVVGVGSFLLGGFKAVMLPIGKALLRGTLGLAKSIGKLVWPAVKWLSKGLGKATWAVAKWSATKLLSGSKFLFKGLGKGLMTGLNKLTGGLATKLVSGIGKTLASSMGKLGGMLGKGGLMGKAGGLLKGAWAGAKALGVKGIAAKAGAFLGKAAIVASGPVGWAIAGAVAVGVAAYAGYKLYKYLKRNDLREDIYGKLTRLRLLVYGVNETNKDYFSKMFDLEMELRNYLGTQTTTITTPQSYSKESKFGLKPLDAEFTTKALKIMGVDRDDKVMSAKLNTWFTHRFIPGYLAFMKALRSTDSKIYLDDIEGLKQEGLEKLLMNYTLPTSVYQITEIPIKDNETILVTEKDINEQLTDIRNNIIGKSKAPTAITNKLTAKNKREKEVRKKEVSKRTVDTNVAPRVKPHDPNNISTPDGEAELEYKEQTNNSANSGINAAINAKLNMAGGNMIAGSATLEGISTKLDPNKILSMDPQMVALFTGMAKEYNMLTGKNISVNEAFRSYEDQAALHRKNPQKAAKPGRSLHEFGLAVDINSVDVQALDKLGLLRKYGFTTSISGETWHLEPIGVSLDAERSKRDMAFRSEMIQKSPGRGGLGYGYVKNVPKWRRNIDYQRSIFDKPNTSIIDHALPNTYNSIAASAADTKRKGNIPTPPTNKVASYTPPSTIPTSPDLEAKPKEGNSFGDKPKLTGRDLLMPGNYNLGNPNGGDLLGSYSSSYEASSVAKMNPEDMVGIESSSGMDPVAAIHQAANMSEMDPELLMTVAKIESGLDPNAKAKTSSATGLFQFIASTWKEMLSKKGNKYGLKSNANVKDPLHNALMGAEYLKGITTSLKSYNGGGLRDDIKAYLGHFLGPGGARSILKAYMRNPNAMMARTVSAKVYRANRSMFEGKTIAQFIKSISDKLDRARGTPATSYKGGKGSTHSAANDSRVAMSSPGTIESNTDEVNSRSFAPPMTGMVSASTMQPGSAPSPYGIGGGMQQSSPSEAMSPVLNSEGVEGLLGQQVSILTTMSNILSSIDGKLPNPDGSHTKTMVAKSSNSNPTVQEKRRTEWENKLNDPKYNYGPRPMTDEEKQDSRNRDKEMYEKRKEALLANAKPVSGNSVSMARTSMEVDMSNY